MPHGLTAGRSEQAELRLPTGWIPTVLVVDDDPSARRILDARLRAAGCRVMQAEDGREGFACAQRERPDLMVVDWMMPGMDGPALCAAVKADETLKTTHILMLTARGGTACLVEALACGADDFVAKPYEPQELMARVRAGLKSRDLHRKLEEANRQLAYANARLIEHQRVLEEDLHHAARFVRSILPLPGTVAVNLRLAWRYTPSRGLGGDLFNICPIDQGRLGVYIMDMSGHGVGAALRAVFLSTILQAESRSSPEAGSPIGLGWREADPALILSHLDGLIPSGDDGEHCTIWLGIWDSATQRLTYASAGHPAPILIRADGTVERPGMAALPLGLWRRHPGENASTRFGSADRLLLFSDGLYEAFNSHGDLWGMDRLDEACRRTRGLSLEAALDALVREVQDWQGEKNFQDDMAIMALQAEASE